MKTAKFVNENESNLIRSGWRDQEGRTFSVFFLVLFFRFFGPVHLNVITLSRSLVFLLFAFRLG
jgi:hypothetical protein